MQPLLGFSAFVGWLNRFGRSDGFELRFALRPPAPARSRVPRGRRGGARRGGERAARRAWWRRNRGRGGGRSCPGPWARAPPPAGARSGARCGRSCETMAFASGRPLSRWLVIPSRAITPADAVLGEHPTCGPDCQRNSGYSPRPRGLKKNLVVPPPGPCRGGPHARRRGAPASWSCLGRGRGDSA